MVTHYDVNRQDIEITIKTLEDLLNWNKNHFELG
jgi:hypothetical protein